MLSWNLFPRWPMKAHIVIKAAPICNFQVQFKQELQPQPAMPRFSSRILIYRACVVGKGYLLKFFLFLISPPFFSNLRGNFSCELQKATFSIFQNNWNPREAILISSRFCHHSLWGEKSTPNLMVSKIKKKMLKIYKKYKFISTTRSF